MKTKMHLILLPVVFVIASMFISCNSVGIAAEEKPTIYVKSQEIVISGSSFCVDLDLNTQCWEKFTDCKGNELNSITIDEFFGIASKGVVNLILGPSLSCVNSFIVEIVGNTKYCCTPRKCYVCG